MDQRAAFKDTVNRIDVVLDGTVLLDRDRELRNHIREIPNRIEDWFSEAKIGRWLGWAQGVACAKGWLTLDECKEINKRYADGR